MSAQGLSEAPVAALCVADRYRLVGPRRVREDGVVLAPADDLVLRRSVLLKMVSGVAGGEELEESPRAAALFAEARLLSRYADSGVARVYDLGIAENIAYTVQQWVEGVTLAEACAQRVLLRPAGAAAVARGLCALPAGLVALIDLADVVVTPEGAPLVISVSSPREFSTTPCLRDEAAVRAVARLLYAALAGDRIGRGTAVAYLVAPHRRRPAVPVELSAVVMRALGPSAAYVDLGALSRALAAFAGSPTARVNAMSGRLAAGNRSRSGKRVLPWPALAGSLFFCSLAAIHLVGGLAFQAPSPHSRPLPTVARPFSAPAAASLSLHARDLLSDGVAPAPR